MVEKLNQVLHKNMTKSLICEKNLSTNIVIFEKHIFIISEHYSINIINRTSLN